MNRSDNNFLHPRYWMIWLLYAFLRILSLLPYSTQMFLGRRIGNLLKHFATKRRNIAEKNLQLCFPAYSPVKRHELLVKHFESLGMSLFEFGISWWWSDTRFRPLAEIEGLEILQTALEKNRGAILLAGHFTTLEIISRVLKLYVDFHPVYRRHNNRLIDKIISNGRISHCGKIIPHDNLRSLIRSLKSNTPVLYIPDQNFGIKQSIFVPFFGIETATVSATSRIAGILDTPVIPIRQIRLENNNGYRLIIDRALDNFPGKSIEDDTRRISHIIEDQVRENPIDYLWVHRRFKTRPEGEPDIYN